MENQTKLVFERFEKKYLMDDEKCRLLLERLKSYIEPDQYADETICNIYYDTPNYELVRSSIEKPAFKQKLRLRSYGIPTNDQNVFLELKKKYDDIVYKRRETLPLGEAKKILNDSYLPDSSGRTLREIKYFIDFYKPVPVLFLSYDRASFNGKEDKSIRITFDRNIVSRQYDLDLAKGKYGELLLAPDYRIMEIKVPSALPMWLIKELSDLKLYPVSFSKYGSIYMNKILKERAN